MDDPAFPVTQRRSDQVTWFEVPKTPSGLQRALYIARRWPAVHVYDSRPQRVMFAHDERPELEDRLVIVLGPLKRSTAKLKTRGRHLARDQILARELDIDLTTPAPTPTEIH